MPDDMKLVFGDPVRLIVPLGFVNVCRVGDSDWVRVNQIDRRSSPPSIRCSSTEVAAASADSEVVVPRAAGTYQLQVTSADNKRLVNLSVIVAGPLTIGTDYAGKGSQYAVTQSMKRSDDL